MYILHDDDTIRFVTCRSVQYFKVLLLGKYKDCVFLVNYYKFEITKVWDFIFGHRLFCLCK